MWRKGNPSALLEGMYGGHYGGQNEDSSRIKNRTIIWPRNPISEYISDGNENGILKNMYLHFMFTAALFKIAKIWRQPNCPSKDEWIKMMYIQHNWLGSHEKEGNPASGKNIDGSWEYYAKWNKLHRKRQILHDITYLWNL